MDASINWCFDHGIGPKGYGYCFLTPGAVPEWLRQIPYEKMLGVTNVSFATRYDAIRAESCMLRSSTKRTTKRTCGTCRKRRSLNSRRKCAGRRAKVPGW